MIIWINETESIPYPPLLPLREILINLDVDIDELHLHKELLNCKFPDCYNKKEFVNSKLKLYGSYMDYFEYEIVISLTNGDLINIIKKEGYETINYYTYDGFLLELLSKKLAKEHIKNFK